MRVVLTDDSVYDADGDRVMVAGIDLERYKKHNILLYNHDPEQPIGHVTDLRIEGSQLTGSLDFDEGKPLAVKLKKELEKGQRGLSIGYVPHESSASRDLMLDGQSRPTTTKCELYELSVVTFPSNPNALKVKNANLKLKFSQFKIIESMELVKKELGLNSGATEARIIEAIKAKNAKIAQIENEFAAFKQKQLEGRVDNLVNSAVSAGKFTAKDAPMWKKLAQQDFETTSNIISAMPVYKSISSQIKKGQADLTAKMTDRKDWDFTKWQKEDPTGLALMRKEAPEQFKELSKTLKTGNG